VFGKTRLVVNDPEENGSVKRRRTWFVLPAVLVALSTAACLGPEPRPREPVAERQIVGKWQGDCGASLTIARDGAVRLEDFPVDYSGAGGVPQRVSGDATWSFAPPVENIRFQELDVVKDHHHYSVEFRLHESETETGEGVQELMLWWSVGDPDSPFLCEFLR
jgi:hypothetical protein